MNRRDFMGMSRYEFNSDRFIYSRWVFAPGPLGHKYWTLSPNGDLTIELSKGGKRLAITYSKDALYFSGLGWRILVAKAMKKIGVN